MAQRALQPAFSVEHTLTTQALQARLSHENDDFGHSVALSASGDVLVVGAPGAGEPLIDDHGSVITTGRAFVFERTADGFVQTAELESFDGRLGIHFGWAVDMSDAGDVIVVGARLDPARTAEGEVHQAGAAYVFKRGDAGWAEQDRLTAPVPEKGASFGQTLALSGDGSTLVVGSPSAITASLGGAYLFVRDSAGFRSASIGLSEGPVGDLSGSLSLDCRGEILAVGAAYRSSEEPDYLNAAGAVDLYARDGDTFRFATTLRADHPTREGGFGHTVALSADGRTLGVSTESRGSAGHQDAFIFERGDAGWSQVAHFPDLAVDTNSFGGAIAFDASATVLAVAAQLERELPAMDFEAPHAQDDLRGSVHLFSRVGGAWAPLTVLKIAHPSWLTYGPSLAFDATGARLVVGASVNGHYPEQVVHTGLPTIHPGWVWIHDATRSDPAPQDEPPVQVQ